MYVFLMAFVDYKKYRITRMTLVELLLKHSQAFVSAVRS